MSDEPTDPQPDPVLGPRFDKALAWAAEIHRKQARKGTPIPYVSHLLAVASLVLEDGGSEDEAIAALLHDAVEDQGIRFEEIEERFGSRVRRIVEGCTDATVRPKPPWKQRKERYIAHLRGADESTCRVSAADKVHNAQSIVEDHRKVGAAVFERFSAPPEDVLWYFQEVARTLRPRGPSALADRLDRLVTEMAERIDGDRRRNPRT